MTRVTFFDDGIVILGDSETQVTCDFAKIVCDNYFGETHYVIVTDPPYGNVLANVWDQVRTADADYAQRMVNWTLMWSDKFTQPGDAVYVWGGVGQPGFRPFFKYVPMVEEQSTLQCHNYITWGKRRGFGLKHNYLFTREELAYFVKGDPRAPRVFNIPLLDVKRGYAGFDKKYPAKSEYKRRTNVWSDINELFRDKRHVAEKPVAVYDIPIQVSSNPDDVIIDIFAGSGTCGDSARKNGRRFLLIEKEEKDFEAVCGRLGGGQQTELSEQHEK